MRAVINGALAAALLAGSSLAGTAPAEARDHTGTAIAAGLIGLGIGAVIASSDHHDRYYSNDSYGYDAPVNYYAQPTYSYGVTYDRGYYGRGYYDRRGYDDRGWRDHDRHDRGDWDRGDRDHDRGDHDRHW